MRSASEGDNVISRKVRLKLERRLKLARRLKQILSKPFQKHKLNLRKKQLLQRLHQNLSRTFLVKYMTSTLLTNQKRWILTILNFDGSETWISFRNNVLSGAKMSQRRTAYTGLVITVVGLRPRFVSLSWSVWEKWCQTEPLSQPMSAIFVFL